MKYQFQHKNYQINRYPETQNKSLQAWNAGDELMLNYFDELQISEENIAIFNDRFGFISCLLSDYQPTSIINYKSQEKAIIINLNANKISENKIKFINPLEEINSKIDIAFIHIPKSVDLFELFLNQLQDQLNEESIVFGGFMTRNFSKQVLQVAEKYYKEIHQTKAYKKARLLILKNPKKISRETLLNKINVEDDFLFQQYYGVFSAKNIDYASQFFMDHMLIDENDQNILDLGCGNGVLAWKARQLNPNSEIHLIDDDFLAIESAKMNLNKGNNYFHFNDDLVSFSDSTFDLVISNPPFHFQFENNIEISLNLFQQVKRILKNDGKFQLVANKHLNYKTHLLRIFAKVETVAENEKFIIYNCYSS